VRQQGDNRPRARDDVIVERLPGELLVYDESCDTAHCLSDAAAAIFELCDGARTRPALAALAAQRLGRAFDENELDTVLTQLRGKALLDGEQAAGDAISRRRVMLAGGGMVAASLITSIVSPLPTAAQSPAPAPGPAPGAPGGPGAPCQTEPDCRTELSCQSGGCCVPLFEPEMPLVPCVRREDCCGAAENAGIRCVEGGSTAVCMGTE